MLGVDTPETVDPRKPVGCFGPEASAETKSLLSHRTVRLVTNSNREARDKYGRYLMYVYRDDGVFVNELLLKEGFAREYTFGRPYLYQNEFRGLEADAKSALRGLWNACT
jgi:micrococcal nuclease